MSATESDASTAETSSPPKCQYVELFRRGYNSEPPGELLGPCNGPLFHVSLVGTGSLHPARVVFDLCLRHKSRIRDRGIPLRQISEEEFGRLREEYPSWNGKATGRSNV